MPAKTYSITINLDDDEVCLKFQKKAGKLVACENTLPEGCTLENDECGWLVFVCKNEDSPIRLQIAYDSARFQLSLMYSLNPDITKVAQYYECTHARMEEAKGWEMTYNEFPEEGNLA